MKKKQVGALVCLLAMFAVPNVAQAEETTVTIFHTNDMHGRAFEGEFDGFGFAKLATLLKEQRDEHSLLLDAGDTLHGTTFATLERGTPVMKALNALEYDAMVAGNHDFNYGMDRLLELKEEANFPILGANVHDKTGDALLDPYTVKDVNGITVGIFGLSTPETAFKTNPNNVKDVTFADPSETAEEMVTLLQEKGADVIIAVAHLGIDGSSTYTSEKVASDVEGIDVIIDGHSHSELKEGMKADNDTLIASAGEYVQNLGVVELKFDDKKLVEKSARLIPREEGEKVEPDKEVAALLDEIESAQAEILSEVVGKTAVELDGERESVRVKETNLGNWVADVLLETTGADVALTNGGGLRASIAAGEITKGDLVSVSPFGNFGVTKEVTGEQLVAALENGVKGYPEPSGGFPHVSGMTFQFDPEQKPGERVHSVEIAGKPVDLAKKYVLATNDFIGAGGDEYDMLVDAKIVSQYNALDELLIAYLQEKGEISPKVEERSKVAAMTEEAVDKQEADDKKGSEKDKEDKKEAPAGTYVVQSGDTLFAIGMKYNVLWTTLHALNPDIKNPDLIYPGDTLVLPKAS
ncbi:5'-nucleotidase C-terminal domain-containing protein [Bacillus sp. FSL W7-1360]